MKPVTLATERLVLDLPAVSDRDLIVEYCRDPLFERFLTTPWPYRHHHAQSFVAEFVPGGWASGDELTWAVRTGEGSPLIGVIGWRADHSDLGFWLGAPHRGNGYMTEATIAVTDWVFGQFGVEKVLWECFVGNTASAHTAKRAGFRFDGERPALHPDRGGAIPLVWSGSLRTGDPHASTEGWPA
jgi:RimJ/RimL family protein N-acetyltransferase